MPAVVIAGRPKVLLYDSNGDPLVWKADVDGTKRLPVQTMPARKIVTGLSTTTNLSANAWFNQSGAAYEDTDGYVMMTVAIYSDKASATDGIHFEYSNDGSLWTWDDVFTLAAGAAKVYTLFPVARYFRVRFQNGAQAQTSFAIQTILHATPFKASVHRIQDAIAEEDDAELVKAILTGKKDSGEFANVALTEDNRLKVASLPAAAPATATGVSQLGDGAIGANQTVETPAAYTIPNGQTLRIQRLIGGGENSVSGGRVELAYRPTGVSSSDELIAVGYIAGGNFVFDLDETFTGNGTRQIVMKRINAGGASMRITGKWQGYVQ